MVEVVARLEVGLRRLFSRSVAGIAFLGVDS